jgi:hypothetical protein
MRDRRQARDGCQPVWCFVVRYVTVDRSQEVGSQQRADDRAQ